MNNEDPETGLGLNIPKPIAYEDRMKTATLEQQGMSREEVKSLLESRRDDDGNPVYEAVEDLEAIVEQGKTLMHNWIDRGLKLSCEGAGHPFHQVWKPHKRY